MKKRMTRLTVGCFTILALAFLGTMPVFADYGITTVPSLGTDTSVQIETAGIGVSKVIGVEALNVLSNATITISAVVGSATNTLYTGTTTATSGSRQYFDLSTTGWFFWARGDLLLRSGTDTNSVLRIIYDR